LSTAHLAKTVSFFGFTPVFPRGRGSFGFVAQTVTVPSNPVRSADPSDKMIFGAFLFFSLTDPTCRRGSPLRSGPTCVWKSRVVCLRPTPTIQLERFRRRHSEHVSVFLCSFSVTVGPFERLMSRSATRFLILGGRDAPLPPPLLGNGSLYPDFFGSDTHDDSATPRAPPPPFLQWGFPPSLEGPAGRGWVCFRELRGQRQHILASRLPGMREKQGPRAISNVAIFLCIFLCSSVSKLD